MSKKMDPNECWEEILFDMSMLYDMATDKDYAARVKWIDGDSVTAVRERLSKSLTDLAGWIAKGETPPAHIEK